MHAALQAGWDNSNPEVRSLTSCAVRSSTKMRVSGTTSSAAAVQSGKLLPQICMLGNPSELLALGQINNHGAVPRRDS